jgi:signal peptidase I
MKSGSSVLLEVAPFPPALRPTSPEDTGAKALFREARRRRRTRRLVSGAAVVVLLAVVVVAGGGRFFGLGAAAKNAGPPVRGAVSDHFRFFTEQAASMEPTLRPGDRIEAITRFGVVARGELVVFYPPSSFFQGRSVGPLIKRIIGLPGDTISSSGVNVLINGRPLRERYLSPGQSLVTRIDTQVVPAGHYFVLGDNRADSADSRYFGSIPTASVIGVATTIVAPPSRAGPVSRRSV